jgi:hypothetical protein
MSYEVKETPFGVLVFGPMPVGDMVALSAVWKKRGLKFLAPGIANALSATLAVTNNVARWEAEVQREVKAAWPNDAEAQWLFGTDVGSSSKTIFSVFCRPDLKHVATRGLHPCLPADADDFGRCYRLLKLFPHWEQKLTTDMPAKWTEFSRQYSRLAGLYESKEFKALNEELRRVGS